MAITDRPMDTLTEAEKLGFRLGPTLSDTVLVWAWYRDSDHTWPNFPTKVAAIVWMEEQIRAGTLFDG
jgi:hypothetical protein